jgi:hypothetical protein
MVYAMRIRIVVAVAALALGACSEASTAPRQMAPTEPRMEEGLTCRSGYHVATRLDGTEYCEEDGE